MCWCVCGEECFPCTTRSEHLSLGSLCLASDLPTSAGPGGLILHRRPQGCPLGPPAQLTELLLCHDPIPRSPRCLLMPGATGDAAVGSTKDRAGFGGVQTPELPHTGSNPNSSEGGITGEGCRGQAQPTLLGTVKPKPQCTGKGWGRWGRRSCRQWLCSGSQSGPGEEAWGAWDPPHGASRFPHTPGDGCCKHRGV